MPVFPTTIEVPIGRFIKYMLIFVLIGVAIGLVVGVVGFKTNWLQSLALGLWQFYVVEHPVILFVVFSIGAVYVLIVRTYRKKDVKQK